jgi:hypothetical protein
MTRHKRSRSRDAVFRIRGLRHGTEKDAAQDRVTPKFCSRPAVGPASARSRLAQVARMERSAIRERYCQRHCRPPDCAALHPGYEERRKKKEERTNKTRQAERRQTPTQHPHHTGAARAQRGALRLPAFHRGSGGSEPTPPFSSRRASWDLAKRRWLAAPACPSPAINSQAGRNAGRALSRSRPGAEVTSPCPRAPLSLRQPE